MARPQIYFINLAHRVDRRRLLEDQLAALGLSAERIEAITPADLPPRETRLFARPANPLGLTPREMACSFSHFETWRRLVASEGDYALVLEDDVVLSRGLPDFLAASPIPGVVKLDAPRTSLRLGPPLATTGAVEIRTLLGRAGCTSAYLIDRPTAIWLLKHTDRLLRRPIDLALFNPYSALGRGLKLRHASPALATTLDRIPGPREPVAGGDILDRKTQAQKTLREVVHELWVAIADEAASRPHHIRQHLIGIKQHEIPFLPD